MKLDAQERTVPELKSDNRLFWCAAAAIAVVGAVALFTVFPRARDSAKGLVFAVGELFGVGPSGAGYSAVYQRLGITPLPARLLASSQISSGLDRLAREPCDKKAIFALGEGLLAAHEERSAADAYTAFATACPNGDGERFRAAEILFLLGDTEKVIAIADALVATNPGVVPYRYLRGKALAGARRYPEAVEDYKSTIELQKDPRGIGEWVFVEMANIYAAMGRPCDAATTILAWVAIDPATRDTMAARKKVEAYSAQGCVRERPPADTKQL